MSRYDSAADLAAKVDWEGGIEEAILNYGIPVDDLPDEVPNNIREAWGRVRAMDHDIRLIERYLSAQLENDDE